MKKALLTFVKAPVAGTVKTRLQKDYGKEKTVRVYKSFITEITSQCSRIRGIDRYLGCAPSDEDAFLKKTARMNNMKTFNQRGSSLGDKILNAFNDYFAAGYPQVVIIGSDSPTIPLEHIRKAFRELDTNEFVIGPGCDGGMYLIGARTTVKAAIFKNILWDSSEVLNRTMENLFRLKINFSLLPFWYDIDNIDDLKFLKLHLKQMKKSFPI